VSYLTVAKKIETYLIENNINKKDIALKMGISEYKLNRILRTPDNILSCITYRNLCIALGISADMFLEERK